MCMAHWNTCACTTKVHMYNKVLFLIKKTLKMTWKSANNGTYKFNVELNLKELKEF